MPNIHIIHATKHVNQTKNRDLAVLQSQWATRPCCTREPMSHMNIVERK
jgi:hypothetical protein